VVEEGLAAGAGVVPVWAAISAVPASINMLSDMLNDVVIRVFITFLSLGHSALTPMDARVLLQVHEVMFLNPFV
jgi:hypothetical protein